MSRSCRLFSPGPKIPPLSGRMTAASMSGHRSFLNYSGLEIADASLTAAVVVAMYIFRIRHVYTGVCARQRYPEFNAAQPKFWHPASMMFRFSPFTCRSGYNGSARVTMLAVIAFCPTLSFRFFYFFKIASTRISSYSEQHCILNIYIYIFFYSFL